ncbi:uncharacterized protein LY89DRAFT_790442 [Mollisia scopiformis]|uniref:Homeobox domain-containing protein n=1 Tax=Mollisia scopiformis TaxID=149040 RepID=A0A132B4J3_MOLSC|nr:uncharacterized protein LY89DRAFT_790442 [Mollisia scopiformis]KUJ06587.1 hypothetical protein LY89DRAFT_790442 [Mollisia scopiformis]
MSSNGLELGQVTLTNSAERIQLSASCAVSFQLPQSLPSLRDADILKALISGHIWTSRGRGCSLDITILLDGKPLDETVRAAFRKGLGQRVQDAKIWNQLSLLPGLDIPTIPFSRSFGPDVSITLKHGHPQAMKAGLKGFLLDKTDVSPPDEILKAEMETIRLLLNFFTIDVPAKPQNPAKQLQQDAELLDQDRKLKTDHLLQLENTVRRISSLPLVVAANFGQFQPILPRLDGSGTKVVPSKLAMETNHNKVLSRSTSSEKLSMYRRYPKEVVGILEAWFRSHLLHPYPTNIEKQDLMKQTGLKKSQISNWMAKSRHKLSGASLVQDEEEMLFSAVHSQVESLEEDIPGLWSQCSEDTESISKASIFSTAASSISEISSQHPSSEPLDLTVACELINGALQTFIGGYYPKIQLPLKVKIEKPVPETSLSQLVPTMFNPGYRELMAHHSRFLPTITIALSVTLPKNVQSPSLKKKLEQIASIPISPLVGEDPSDNVDGSDSLSRVIQTSLFSMMQRTLYHPPATRKLWKEPKPATDVSSKSQDSDSSPDLLEDENPGSSNWDEILAHFTSDDDFDDLLYGDDEDELDLLDESERERLAIERETDEMLFGDGWDGEEEDEFLLSGGESDGENMLL